MYRGHSPAFSLTPFPLGPRQTSRQTDWSSQEQANALYGGMATSEGMQWPGDQQRMLPQPDAAVLASGHMPPSSMWQLSSGLGVPPTSAALAMDHPALGFSLLQTRMQAPQKQETGPMAGPSGNHAQPSGQAMSGPFTSLGMYGGDFGALNPMPVVGLSGLLPGMNPPSGSSQGYAAVQQRQQQGIQQGELYPKESRLANVPCFILRFTLFNPPI